MKTLVSISLLSLHLASLSICSALDTVIKTPSASLSAGGHSFLPVLSADGSQVVFLSHANNLVTNDNRREWLDVFARNLITSNTVLVSVTASGTGGGNGNSSTPTISSNGQFVAFASDAGDLVNGDTNSLSDIFVRDLITGTTRLISRSPLRNVLRNPSLNPILSSDARFVVFESYSPEISSGVDSNNAADVFRYDSLSNETILVSARIPFAGVLESANAASSLSSITPDGQRVALISTATNLTSGVSNSLGDVYVRDMISNVTFWASASLSYTNGYRCLNAVLSENGRYVAFVVLPAFEPPALYRRDLSNNILALVATNVSRLAPQISADGRYVAFDTGTNVFRWDGNNGMAELVNVDLDGLPPSSGLARQPVMTPAGNNVAFLSDCENLTTNNFPGVVQLYVRNISGGVTHLVSVATNGSPGGVGSEVSLYALAHDASRMVFDSSAENIAVGDGNRANDVFVRNLPNAGTQMISARHSSMLRTTGIGHALLSSDSTSADGRFVAFSSYDNDLVSGDTNGWPDVFVHDTLAGTTVTPGFSTNMAKFPVISSNGRFVAYSRYVFMGNVGTGPISVGLFRFDRQTGTVEPVVPDGSPAYSGARCAISPDGNLIAFRSNGNLLIRNMMHGTNLNLGAAQTISDSSFTEADAAFTPDGRFLLFRSTELYAYDLLSNRVHLVSSGSASGYTGGTLCVSGNSRFALLYSGSVGLFIHDLITETNSFIYPGVPPAVSTDAQIIAFRSRNSSHPWNNQIVVHDRQTGLLELVARNTNGAPAASSFFSRPAVSGNGRFVVFGSRAADLVENDTNGFVDIFVRDRLLGTTTLISRNVDAGSGNAESNYRLTMAADGRTVFFQSLASDLVPGDYNDKRDIFVLKLGGADTDGDGMDDDWEVVYFENLSRNGLADFDGDGVGDRAEFLAGTDPTNSNSVFRVLTIAPAGGAGKTLIWSGNPTRSYRAEFKDDLGAANWTALTGAISWNGSSAAINDSSASAATNRYYRVVRLP